jgi:hypothetical protein
MASCTSPTCAAASTKSSQRRSDGQREDPDPVRNEIVWPEGWSTEGHVASFCRLYTTDNASEKECARFAVRYGGEPRDAPTQPLDRADSRKCFSNDTRSESTRLWKAPSSAGSTSLSERATRSRYSSRLRSIHSTLRSSRSIPQVRSTSCRSKITRSLASAVVRPNASRSILACRPASSLTRAASTA